MDRLLIACGVMWQEEWKTRVYDLKRMIAVDREGLRLSGLTQGSKDYWARLTEEHEHELALLQNVRDAMDAAREEALKA